MRPLAAAAAALALALGAPAVAQETVTAPDTEVEYPVERTLTVDGEEHDLRLTGVGLREKVWFNVYAIGSYIAADAEADSAEDVAAADVVKLLHLVMERDVSGEDAYEAFKDAIVANYPDAEEDFADELDTFEDFFGDDDVETGVHIRFVHLPGQGVRMAQGDDESVDIANLEFARAIWDIYFGEECVDEDIKEGLTSRLD